MKKKVRKQAPRDESCLLIAESGAPWAECVASRSGRSRHVETMIQMPHELPSAFLARLQEKLRFLGDVKTVVFVAASASQRLVLRSTLLRALVGAIPSLSRVVLCPGSDPKAPAARELAGLSVTMREILDGAPITFSLEGVHGEALQGLGYLAAA